MSLAAFSDANKWLDRFKISFQNAEDAAEEAASTDAIVKAAVADLYPLHVNLWDSVSPAVPPQETTPALIVEASAMLMASQRFNKIYSMETMNPSSYGVGLEARAMRLLNDLRNGSKSLADETYTSELNFGDPDFWPNDSTVITEEDFNLAGMGDIGDPLRAFRMNKVF